MYHFEMIKQKVYLLLENLHQLIVLSIGLVLLLVFDWYLFQLIVPLKPDFNYPNGFASSWVDKVTTATYCFVSVNKYIAP